MLEVYLAGVRILVKPIFKSIGLLACVILLSGCMIGGPCWKELTLQKIIDITNIESPIHNATRSDLTNIPWLIFEFAKFLENKSSYYKEYLSDENFTVMYQTFVNLGFITNTTNASSIGGGEGAKVTSGYWNVLFIYIRFEQMVLSLDVTEWCGA